MRRSREHIVGDKYGDAEGGWCDRVVVSWMVDRQVNEQLRLAGLQATFSRRAAKGATGRTGRGIQEEFLQTDIKNKEADSKSPG
ncbi:hypothetical protein CHARACLAT_031882 [Characodon lateralis]|uniref:Uncharacterized protein n=1 Tax=Characodon lateralis TaxID=208331 RepID=A0ABU7CV98_9TELE|nr:hypothetical protein [Characodon lateralis]